MRHAKLTGIAAASLLLAAAAQAQESHEVEMSLVSADGVEDSIGTITLEETEHGLLLTPELSDLSAGVYGFPVHENASCGPGAKDGGGVVGAGEAGGGYVAEDRGTEEGPSGAGHLGDLP